MNSYKKVLPYLKPYKWKLSLVLVLGLFMSATEASVAVATKMVFDQVFEKKNFLILPQICYGLIGIYFIHGIARYFHLFNLKLVSEKVAAQIRYNLQSKFMDLSTTFHSETNPGALLSKITNDVINIQDGFKRVADLIREPFTALALFSWVLYMDWKLTLFIIIAAPLIFRILQSLSKSAQKYSHLQMEALEDVTYSLKETLDGLRIIQSFNLQHEMRVRLKKVLDYFVSIRAKVISREESSGPITEFLGAVVIAGVIYYKAGHVINGTATSGDFMSYFAALALLQPPIKKLQDAVVRMQVTNVSIDRIFDLLDSSHTMKELANPQSFPTDFKSIEFKNVSFAYDNHKTILNNINLTIKKGEIIALVGESGCGKSTLVNLLERFYDVSAGEILIGGTNIQNISLYDLRQNIALVTQDVFLFNDTITKNIQAGNFERETIPVKQAAELANADSFIGKTQNCYETPAGDRGARLSGGEKQRISIARAIYKNAPILILDEATSALDSVSELEVQQGLDQLVKGRTVFVIAHRLSTISSAHRICVLKDGQIIEEGTHGSLLNLKGHYFNFHQLQS